MSCSAAQLIEFYFQELEARGIRGVILHSHEKLPGCSGSDVDYAVKVEALAKLPAILRALAERHGWIYTGTLSSNLYSLTTVLACADRLEEFVQFDACSHAVHSDIWLATCEELMVGSTLSKGFWITSPAAEFQYLLAKNLAKKRPIQRIHARLRTLWEQDPQGTAEAFSKLLGRRHGDLATWLQRDTTSWDHLHSALRSRHRFGLRLWVLESVRLLRRSLRPQGFHLSVLGPDGVGKSTLLGALSTILGTSRFRSMETYHFRPGTLRPTAAGLVVTAPHARAPRSWPSCVLKVFFYFFDHLLGWFQRVYPAKVRNRLVIFDRDFNDILVDPKRYRLQAVGVLASLLTRFIPRADLTIILHAPAEAIYQRKPELPKEEITRQLEALRKLADARCGWLLVDADRPVAMVARDTVLAILQTMKTQ